MDGKKLQTYASLAEVLSALAIVASLIYVATEFRRTSTMSSREADVILFERGREANRLLIESPGLAEIVAVAQTAPEDLSDADRLRYLTYRHDFFDTWEIAWYYHEDGILEDDVWQEWDGWFGARARQQPLFGWTDNRDNFTGAEFRRHVDAVLEIENPRQ